MTCLNCNAPSFGPLCDTCSGESELLTFGGLGNALIRNMRRQIEDVDNDLLKLRGRKERRVIAVNE